MFFRKPHTSRKNAPATASPEVSFWAGHSEKDALKTLRTSRAGLSKAEAEKRLAAHGLNTIQRARKFQLLSRVVAQLKNPIVLILLISGVLLLFVDSLVDAYLIFAILLINIVIAVVQEGRVSHAFELLRSTDQLYTLVFRGGQEVEILAQEIVPGDIVLFKTGSKAPADIRVLQQDGLQTNESVLTGEWMPVEKEIVTLVNERPIVEQTNMVWKGTTIVSGSGIGVVVATGRHTVVGGISEHLYEPGTRTPLQKQVQQLAQWIMGLVFAVVLVIIGVALLRGIPLADALLTAIAVAVAGIPSGLPAAITVVLVFGMRSVLRSNGLVRNLLAAETLGSTTWILTDKTGTLTSGNMRLSEIIFTGSREQVSDAAISPFGRSAVLYAYLGTNGRRTQKEEQDVADSDDEDFVLSGSAIEQAFVRACEDVCTSSPTRESRLAHVPFSSAKRYSSSLVRSQGGDHTYCVVGAPEVVIDRADSVYDKGVIKPLLGTKRNRLLNALSEEAAKGKRIIAVGIKSTSFPDEKSGEEALAAIEEEEESLTFVSFLVLEDAVRTGVSAAITSIRRAHVSTTMVTGDNPDTALFVAKKSGIVGDGDSEEVLLGSDIRTLTDDELFAKAKQVRVFARMLPDQKSRLLSALLERGEVVAMTGDGVNDAPALHRASIGIAVGSGTDVAKEASDLILLQNSFATIVDSIMEGRRILRNLKKILIYLLSTSFSEAALVAGGLLIASGLPITPVQILWANIIEEAFVAFTFAFEKADIDVSKLDPRNRQTGSIISGNVRMAIIILALTVGLFLIGTYGYLSHYTSLSHEQVQTVMFLAISVDSIFLAFTIKRLNKSLFKTNPFTNWWLVGAIVISSGLLVLAFIIPQLSVFLSIVPLPSWAFLIIPLSALFHIVVVESVKMFFFKEEMRSKTTLLRR